MLNLEKNFIKKRILIYGLGKSGLSTYSFLKKNNVISLFDDRIITKKKIKDTHTTYKKIIKKEFLNNLVVIEASKATGLENVS